MNHNVSRFALYDLNFTVFMFSGPLAWVFGSVHEQQTAFRWEHEWGHMLFENHQSLQNQVERFLRTRETHYMHLNNTVESEKTSPDRVWRETAPEMRPRTDLLSFADWRIFRGRRGAWHHRLGSWSLDWKCVGDVHKGVVGKRCFLLRCVSMDKTNCFCQVIEANLANVTSRLDTWMLWCSLAHVHWFLFHFCHQKKTWKSSHTAIQLNSLSRTSLWSETSKHISKRGKNNRCF